MSVEPSSSGLSAVQAASAPEWVRKGSPELQHDYAVGLEFEQLLAQQLSGAMTASAGLGEEGGSGGEEEGSSGGFGGAGSSLMSSQISGAFANGVAGNGGLGLAAELARDMQSQTGTAPASTTAATPSLGGVTQSTTTGGTSS